MIACQRCGKENQDHYKFCLGCGAEINTPPPTARRSGSQDMGMMKTMMADPSAGMKPHPTPPSGMAPVALPGMSTAAPPPMYQRPAGPPPGVPTGTAPAQPNPLSVSPLAVAGGPRRGPAVTPAPAHLPTPSSAFAAAPPSGSGNGAQTQTAMKECPSCGEDVPATFKFCGACGNRIEETIAQMPRTTDNLPEATPATQSLGRLTLIRPDGTEGGIYELTQEENVIGRETADLFSTDGYLSPTHAELIINAAGAVIRDLDSLNGIYVKMADETVLPPGQIIRIGQELLRFDFIDSPEPLADGTEVMGSPNPGYWGKITVMLGDGIDGAAYPLLGESVTIGRDRGEINFPEDGYISGLHARISMRGGKVYLADLGSSNGSFVKVEGEIALHNDSFMLLGQQLFRLNLRG